MEISKKAHARDVAAQLETWEGEYHYPAGLLAEGSRVIKELLEEIHKMEAENSSMGWALNPDGMGK